MSASEVPTQADAVTTAPTSTSPLDVEALRRLEAAGERLRFLFFYGHQEQAHGGVGPGCLSQWWPAPFTADGVTYHSAEHSMMAGKARLFGDERTLARILAASHPGAAKRLGRQVSPFDEDTWRAHRFDIVVATSIAKFSADPELRSYLLSTGDRVLVEASPRDRVWGIGMSATHEHAPSPSRWRGLNLLGFALMRAREVLAAQE